MKPMAKRSRRSERRRDEPAAEQTQERPPRREGRKKQSSGLGPIFFIMAGIVLAVIVGGFAVGAGLFSGKEEPKAQPQRVDVMVDSNPKSRWAGKVVPPWNGIAQGMTKSQVIAKLGSPQVFEGVYHHGYEKLEYFDDPDRGYILTDAGGARLTVFCDVEPPNKVLYFIPPQRD